MEVLRQSIARPVLHKNGQADERKEKGRQKHLYNGRYCVLQNN